MCVCVLVRVYMCVRVCGCVWQTNGFCMLSVLSEVFVSDLQLFRMSSLMARSIVMHVTEMCLAVDESDKLVEVKR